MKDDEAPHRPGHKLHSHQSNMDSLIAKLDGFVDGELVMAEARDVPHATYSESRRELFQPFSGERDELTSDYGNLSDWPCIVGQGGAEEMCNLPTWYQAHGT